MSVETGMTLHRTQNPDTATGAGFVNPRLVRLFLVNRQAPLAALILAGCAVAMQLAIHLHWVQGDGAVAQELPLLIEAVAAVTIAVMARSPFGALERTAGRLVPVLRTLTVLAMTLVAAGVLMIGAAVPGGAVETLRNVAGMTGLGLVTAAALGGPLAWICPTAFAMVGEYAVTGPWTTPWMWLARPAHDLGANLCAGGVFAAGMVAIAVWGARDTSRD